MAYQKLNIKTDFKKIHVAGTNGKGSTSAFISRILIEKGLKVGTFISPYLLRFNERIQYNMTEIADSDLLYYLNYLFDFNETFIDEFGESLVFFEIITLAALLYFSAMECDVIVMEVGIGGLLDATNILNYDVSVITNIGFDHMKQLGNTLALIATNKLGIIKKNNHLVTYAAPELADLFSEYADKQKASVSFLAAEEYTIISEEPLRFVYKDITYQASLSGDFQVKNAILAINAVSYLFPDISIQIVQNGILKATNPGRFEVIRHEPLTLIDGAHNIHGIDALIDAIKSYTKKHVWIIFCALKDKQPVLMIDALKSLSQDIIITSFKDSRIMNVADCLLNADSVLYIKDLKNAYRYVRKMMAPDDLILITGSIHFIGYARKKIKVKRLKPSTI